VVKWPGSAAWFSAPDMKGEPFKPGIDSRWSRVQKKLLRKVKSKVLEVPSGPYISIKWMK